MTENEAQVKIAKVATVLAQTLYEQVTGGRIAPLFPSKPVVPAAHSGGLRQQRRGVFGGEGGAAVCGRVHNYSQYYLKGWDHKGVCIQTTMNFSQAVSPAFVKTDYNFTSGEYSTWTESVWQTMWVRVFVSSSGAGARLAAITGVFATVLAAVTTYWLQNYAPL
ncbi:unnamed protein product [Leptidea sinapis]|uniref:Uncharacterized protein n=1 Tax=Leptidea sinapis TaxID=189913 RepID=A0A5E4Q950_9NEOP|nr:unnamed protein product [Leptidea sinapis]